MINTTLDFILSNWIIIAAAYGIVYSIYVLYFLYSIRFKEVRRVTSYDFKDACREAVFGPFILPCRMAGDALSAVKVSILAMVNIGLPAEAPKEPFTIKGSKE